MHDGDTVSNNFVFSKEANDEIVQYLDSKRSVVTPSTTLAVGINTDIAKQTIFNLSRKPSELELTKHK